EHGAIDGRDIFQRGPAVECGAATGTEDLLFAVELTGVRFPDAAIARYPTHRVGVARRVEPVALVEQHEFASDGARLGMTVDRVNQCREPARLGFGVVVEEGNELRGAGADPQIDPLRQASVAFEAKQSRAR